MDPLVTSERELVRPMLAGEEGAFNTFFVDYFPRVGGDAAAAKDFVQATLAKACAANASFAARPRSAVGCVKS